MQSALGTGDLAHGTGSADELVTMTTRLLEELDRERNRDNDNDHEHDAELIAALRVYRNAAFAFRKLAGARDGLDGTLRAACVAMIELGHDHVRAYWGRDDPLDEPGSPDDPGP
ncbi:MAG TPA: hypothetical protein VID75_09680 [Acidimicrobiales bacterium]